MIGALSQYRRENLCGFAIAEAAAANYRLLRSRGITVRGTIDVVIATWCVENDAAIIHNDRDLAAMEGLLGLRAYKRVGPAAMRQGGHGVRLTTAVDQGVDELARHQSMPCPCAGRLV